MAILCGVPVGYCRTVRDFAGLIHARNWLPQQRGTARIPTLVREVLDECRRDRLQHRPFGVNCSELKTACGTLQSGGET